MEEVYEDVCTSQSAGTGLLKSSTVPNTAPLVSEWLGGPGFSGQLGQKVLRSGSFICYRHR